MVSRGPQSYRPTLAALFSNHAFCFASSSACARSCPPHVFPSVLIAEHLPEIAAWLSIRLSEAGARGWSSKGCDR